MRLSRNGIKRKFRGDIMGGDKMEARTDPLLTLHREATVFLSCVGMMRHYFPDGVVDYSVIFQDDPRVQATIPRLRRGDVDVIFAAPGAPDARFPGKEGVGRTCQILSSIRQAIAAHSDQVEVASGPGDIPRINSAGRLAVFFQLEGSHLDGDLATLYGYYLLGLRSIHPPFDDRFPNADMVGNEEGGLTNFGRDVIKEMNRLGMAVDVSHCSDKSLRQILDMVDKPVMASHSNCRALCNVPRNLSDEQIRAIGENGGVIGIHFASGFIDCQWMADFRATGFHEQLLRWETELAEKYSDRYLFLSERFNVAKWQTNPLRTLQKQVPAPPLAKLIDHLDHVVGIAGIDHVGIGTDYDCGSIPEEVWSADRLPNLTRSLAARGYLGEDIKKILGGNFLRLYRDVQPG